MNVTGTAGGRMVGEEVVSGRQDIELGCAGRVAVEREVRALVAAYWTQADRIGGGYLDALGCIEHKTPAEQIGL